MYRGKAPSPGLAAASVLSVAVGKRILHSLPPAPFPTIRKRRTLLWGGVGWTVIGHPHPKSRILVLHTFWPKGSRINI